MRKSLLVACALVLATTCALSAGEQMVGAESRGSSKGRIVEVDRIQPSLDPAPVQLPTHQDDQVGPAALGSDMMVVGSGAIVRPRGGAFMSPRERSDQAIRRTIRRLG